MSGQSPVTTLLLDWRQGNKDALDQLMPIVYEELRRLADRHMRGERQEHTLQTTALVHEAYARLIDVDVPWQDRVHFFAVASRMMRRILVDHAKSRSRQKRGGGAVKVTLDAALAVSPQRSDDVLALDDALIRLTELDPRKGQIVELHFFGGLTYAETAEAIGVSPATVDRELRMAKAWLYRDLSEETGSAG
jgi:RNA polymerase sigma factor (TIGR02999 family)